MLEADTPHTPWHLWAVAVVAVLFTSFGCYDYFMTQSADRAYIEAAMAPAGVDADAALAYFADFPVWLDAIWAIGVWGGFAGALLLLLRNRFAFPVFVASITAFVVSNAYGMANPIPGMDDPSMVYTMTAVVFAVMLFLTLYARAMAARGVLR